MANKKPNQIDSLLMMYNAYVRFKVIVDAATLISEKLHRAQELDDVDQDEVSYLLDHYGASMQLANTHLYVVLEIWQGNNYSHPGIDVLLQDQDKVKKLKDYRHTNVHDVPSSDQRIWDFHDDVWMPFWIKALYVLLDGYIPSRFKHLFRNGPVPVIYSGPTDLKAIYVAVMKGEI